MVLHCYGTLSARESASTKYLFFLDVGRMPTASRESIQFHMVNYCSAIKFNFTAGIKFILSNQCKYMRITKAYVFCTAMIEHAFKTLPKAYTSVKLTTL